MNSDARTLNSEFEAALKRFAPDRMAFACDETRVTFGHLAALVDRLAAGLREQGVKPADVVGYSLHNCPEAIALLLAISRLGASAVPLFPMMPASVRTGIFAALECSLVVAGDAAESQSAPPPSAPSAQQSPPPFKVVDLAQLRSASADCDAQAKASPDHRLLAAASSGTTGAPKFVWITQGNAAAVVIAASELARLGDWQTDPNFCTMMAFPLSTSGVLVTLAMLFAGARLVFSRDTSPVRYCELAERWGADALSAPPSYFEHILSLPPEVQRPLPALRAIYTGMDFISDSLLTRLAARFPGLDRAASGYGLVETSTVFMCWKAHDRSVLREANKPFTLCDGVDNRIDVRDEQGNSVAFGEHGELWVQGPSVVSGYHGRAQAGSEPFVDGWFRTGDVARRIDERTVELCGRKKYLIKRGGKSIAPLEVEAKLEACAGVLSCAVVGVKQALYGEMIWAFIVPDRACPPSLKDIMRECRSALPNYMVPDQVTFLDALPRGSGVGKLDREALVRRAEQELERIQGGSRG